MSRIHQEASLSDDVYYHLKDYILYDVAYPAERLHLAQLSEHFGVSITPIREALIRLAAESIIDSKPGRGFFYKEYSTSEQTSLYELIFFLLESVVARASARTPVRFLFDVKGLVPAGGNAATRSPTLVRANVVAVEQLAEQIVLLSGNKEVASLMRNLCERTRTSRILDLEQPTSAAVMVEDLTQLAMALQRGDIKRAVVLLRALLEKKRRRIPALANERRRRVYEAHPLLRPGTGRQVLYRYGDKHGETPPEA